VFFSSSVITGHGLPPVRPTVLDWGPEVLRDVAMANIFWLSMGYNFGCVIASGTIFDTRGWVFGVKLSDEDIAEIKCLRVVAMVTNQFWDANCYNWLCVNDSD